MRQNRGPWQTSPMSPTRMKSRRMAGQGLSVWGTPGSSLILADVSGDLHRVILQASQAVWAMWATFSPRISKRKLSPTCSNLTFGFIRDPSAVANSELLPEENLALTRRSPRAGSWPCMWPRVRVWLCHVHNRMEVHASVIPCPSALKQRTGRLPSPALGQCNTSYLFNSYKAQTDIKEM